MESGIIINEITHLDLTDEITHAYPGHPEIFETLLKDRTTGKNIIWATDAYEDHAPTDEILVKDVTDTNSGAIKPRVKKSIEAQRARTRLKAEVFTPGWVVCLMNGYADSQWFNSEDPFAEVNGTDWKAKHETIAFPPGKSWKEYVTDRRLEITCGEAPFLVTRYDVTTGELMPVEERTGLLDRKLRVVGENTESEAEWLKWARKAVESTYGYEFQGDSLLIARINVFQTFADFMFDKFGHPPKPATAQAIAERVSWNIWQMDGLTDTIPFGDPEPANGQIEEQFNMLDLMGGPEYTPFCQIKIWTQKGDKVIRTFHSLKNSEEETDEQSV